MDSLYQNEIRALEDKDLQLRYMLGGLNTDTKTVCGYNSFWSCDIRCSCTPVPNDDNFTYVKEFMQKHNIGNETFMRLTLSYLKGYLLYYKDEFSELFTELDTVLNRYKFKYASSGHINNNTLGEKELEKLIEQQGPISNSKLNQFLQKYNLSQHDFMTLAKTSLNYHFKVMRGFDVYDLPVDLHALLDENRMYNSWEYVKIYRKSLDDKNYRIDKKRKFFDRIVHYRRKKNK